MNAVQDFASASKRVWPFWASLAMAHAVAVSGGLLIAWGMRTWFDPLFARWAETPWVWALLLWPLWWLVGLIVARMEWRSCVWPLLTATAVWLVAAIPAALLAWSMRGFR